MNRPITSFTQNNSFLSNFFLSPVRFDGIDFITSEHAFQAAKTHDFQQRRMIAALDTPGKAKRKGKKISLRDDWENVKVSIMEQICFLKFTQNKELGQRLLDTGDLHLEEGNTHGDKIWGTVDGEGQNLLGQVLMRVRDRIRQGNNQS